MLRKSMLPRLASGGRGSEYTLTRGLVESTLRILYAGGWPARLWALVPGVCQVRVIRHQLTLLGGLARPLRIAFASDLHLGPTTPSQTLDAAFEALEREQADLLVLGGDYVFLDINDVLAEELHQRIAALSAPIKVAVLGNHDLWTDTSSIESALQRSGVRVLINDALGLPAPFEDVAILGLDDPWTGSPDPARALAACGAARLRLAVAHSPDGVAFFPDASIALLLSGHTHGGQIALPGERPIVLPPGPYSKRFAYGLHRVNGYQLFVSRGIGATELPIRTYAQPEIAIFDVS